MPADLNRALAATAAACLVAACTACGKEDTDPLDGVPAFPVDEPKVSLIEPGANPQQLRYRDTGEAGGAESTGGYETMVVVSSGIDQRAQRGDVDKQAPAGGDVEEVTLPLTVTPSPAGEPGDGETAAARRVLVEVGDASHSDLSFSDQVASAKGFLLGWRAAEAGAISTVKMLAPEGSSDDGRQAVERALLSLMSATVVFPDQPVGVGGSWSVESRVTGNASLIRTTTYTVASIDGDRVGLDVSVQERPADSSLTINNQAAGSLNGETLKVESTSTTSDAHLTVDLARPLPVDGRVAATTRLVYSGEGGSHVIQDITSAVTYGKE